MNICFVGLHRYWGGLNNSGGSKTIIKSAETLRKIGHRVDIAAVNDRHTWVNHPKITHEIPKDCDVAIANSISDVDIVLKQAPGKARKFWWCRGKETWQMPEKKILVKAGKINTIVNASHLLDWIPNSQLCYSGLDTHFWWYRFDCIIGKKTPKIGFLKNKQHKSKRYDLCKKLKSAMPGTQCYKINGKQTPAEVRAVYRLCNIWFSPVENEGFHQCAAEANLVNSLVVCNRLPSNGMGDYATDETADRYDTWEELLHIIQNPNWAKAFKMRELLESKIGSREKNMEKFIKLIS